MKGKGGRGKNGKVKKIPGRNVLPYESTTKFGEEVINFVQIINS